LRILSFARAFVRDPDVVIVEEEYGGYSVAFPDVPEALTCGKGRAEALEMAEDALVVALRVYVDGGEEVPVPSAVVDGQELVAVPLVVAAKLALYSAMRRENVTRSALAVRLGVSESAARRLLDLGHRSHIGDVEGALHAMGRSLVIGDRALTGAAGSSA